MLARRARQGLGGTASSRALPTGCGDPGVSRSAGMTLVTLPRLDRDAALKLSERRHLPLEEIQRMMPDTESQVWFSPVGGARISDEDLGRLRQELLDVAVECGMPARMAQAQQQQFEG